MKGAGGGGGNQVPLYSGQVSIGEMSELLYSVRIGLSGGFAQFQQTEAKNKIYEK